jgi:hypothetical protein
METLFAGLTFMIVTAIFALAAMAYGVDSRDESADPHRAAYPVGID